MMKSKRTLAPAMIALGALMISGGAMAAKKKATVAKGPAPIERVYAKPDSFIATSTTVPKGYTTIYLSGALPDVADPNAPKGSIASYGNTETQSESVFNKLEAALKAHGAGPGDVVSMRVFLLGDPALDGKMDFMGMMNAYKRHYGTPEQPNRPVRATVQVAGLAGPGFLVEIEAIAAIPAK